MNRHEEAARSRLSAFGPARPKPLSRRGFNLIELLLALSISALLLTATMVALRVSFMAYQSTTEVASTHTIARLAMHRMLALIRTGTEFGPVPADPHDEIVAGNEILFRSPTGTEMQLLWDPGTEALYIDPDTSDADAPILLLEGVVEQLDEDGDPVPPFTLEFERGFTLYRATIDLTIVPDDNMDVDLDGVNEQVIRLVASAMPRRSTY